MQRRQNSIFQIFSSQDNILARICNDKIKTKNTSEDNSKLAISPLQVEPKRQRQRQVLKLNCR
jgi:hypothetical protein